MTDPAPRLLFIPVSGRYGMGEYARSVAIASAAAARWPSASIHFMLSRAAPYAAGVPFPATLLDASPTLHAVAVSEFISTWRPDLVVFDNAGRTSQLRAARRVGARVVFVSARARQRRKAFRWRWLRLIDEHWIAYPRFIAGGLGAFERLKLAILRRPQVRFLDVIMARESTPIASAGDATDSILVVPGGGTGHPNARDATDEFLRAALALAATGIDVVFVGSEARAVTALGADAARSLRRLGAVPQADLVRLMRTARLIVTNGGSTLLQALACNKPCVGVPIAADQRKRVRCCVDAGVAVGATLDAGAIAEAASRLWADPQRLNSLAQAAAALHLADGISIALQSISALLWPAMPESA